MAPTERWTVGTALLALLAGGVLAFGAGDDAEIRRRAGPFQHGVAGVGTGPAVHPATCGRAFDLRVAPHCAWRHGPVPGADRFCPLHGAAAPPADPGLPR